MLPGPVLASEFLVGNLVDQVNSEEEEVITDPLKIPAWHIPPGQRERRFFPGSAVQRVSMPWPITSAAQGLGIVCLCEWGAGRGTGRVQSTGSWVSRGKGPGGRMAE